MSPELRKISEIDVNHSVSWDGVLFLTFDIDWACDEVLLETIDLVEAANVSATWFVTHETPVLKRLRKNPKFELGIHPNFNDLLNGDFRNGENANEVLNRLMDIVPEAKSVRCHSLTQNSRILQLFKNKGLTYECSNFIPSGSLPKLNPYELWNQMVSVPFHWEDDVNCFLGGGWNLEDFIFPSSLNVFNFHPIHVYLNSEDLSKYEASKKYFNDQEGIQGCINKDSFGTRNFLSELLGWKRLKAKS